MKIVLVEKKIIVDDKTEKVQAMIAVIQEKTAIANVSQEQASIKQKYAEEQAVIIKKQKEEADEAIRIAEKAKRKVAADPTPQTRAAAQVAVTEAKEQVAKLVLADAVKESIVNPSPQANAAVQQAAAAENQAEARANATAAANPEAAAEVAARSSANWGSSQANINSSFPSQAERDQAFLDRGENPFQEEGQIQGGGGSRRFPKRTKKSKRKNRKSKKRRN